MTDLGSKSRKRNHRQRESRLPSFSLPTILNLIILLAALVVLIFSSPIKRMFEHIFKIIPAENNSGTFTSELDAALSKLPTGTIAHQVPTSIPLEGQSKATLILSPEATYEDFQTKLSTFFPIKLVDVKIGQKMRATLKGTNSHLSITAHETAEQAISFEKDTEWNWTITPNKPGKEIVILTLEILLKIDGNESYRSIESYSEKIEITTTPWTHTQYFVKANWQYIITTLLIPLIGYVFARWRKKGNEAKQG